MADFVYCLVESTYVVRQHPTRGGAEYLTPGGEWIDYDDEWDVITNGRALAGEAEALATAKELFERDPAWWAWQDGMRQGDEAFRRGDHDEAERQWRAWLDFDERDPRLARTLDSLARLYREQGRADEAAELAARAAALRAPEAPPKALPSVTTRFLDWLGRRRR